MNGHRHMALVKVRDIREGDVLSPKTVGLLTEGNLKKQGVATQQPAQVRNKIGKHKTKRVYLRMEVVGEGYMSLEIPGGTEVIVHRHDFPVTWATK